jgi:hypothetical protein
MATCRQPLRSAKPIHAITAVATCRGVNNSSELIRCSLVGVAALASLLSARTAAYAQIDVPTNRYDAGRSGVNLNETTLTDANVNVGQFGKLYSYPVDGSVYAQPLYLANVTIGGARHNVLYIATMKDKLYAFDADSSSPSPLWMRDFTSATSTPVPIADISDAGNIWYDVGIEGTPVINRDAGTLYLVARTKESTASGASYVQQLHALDITTGAERVASPVTITGSVPGNAPDGTATGDGQAITFNPKMQQQRSGLAIAHGVVLIAWGSHEDLPPYHGWIMAYNATTLAQVGVFAVSPDYGMSGIWQGGRAPTIDRDGNAYFATGNGVWDGHRNYGDSLLKFKVTTSGLVLDNYFTPWNAQSLYLNDDDLSGSGFTLLPDTFTGLQGKELLFGGGKEGVLYLIDAGNLGKQAEDDAQILQTFPTNGGHVMGGPVFWNSSSKGRRIYNWAEDDYLRAYEFRDGKVETANSAAGSVKSPGHPGGSLTITANGATAGTGIVWASIPTTPDAKHNLSPGILRAYNAETLEQIWTSDQNFDRDHVGTLVKFVPPLVVNGKVYMASHDGAVHVYGLLPPTDPNVPAEVVLHAKNASPVVGNWRLVADSTAASGARIEQRDAGAPKVATPLASPANYFELTFSTKANTPYRLWIRGRAQNNSYLNDSVYVQFSGSVSTTGTPNYRIGTTGAVTVVIEDCSGCGLSGWGWADNGYGVNAPPIYFTEGEQTIRIQGREDGISIDQIVLSPGLYLNKSPGTTKNDTTILPSTSTSPPPPPPPPSPPPTRTIVKWAAVDVQRVAGNWVIVDDTSAAGGKRIEQPDFGVPKIAVPSASPANYFELTFTAEANTPYRLWVRGRAQKDSYLNDSVYVQFSGSVSSNGTPIYVIDTTEAVTVVIEDCSGCSLAGWGWQDNAYGTGALGPLLYFTAGTHTIRVQGREDGISIDQIVLSPDTYLSKAPGPTKNDTTILPKTPE